MGKSRYRTGNFVILLKPDVSEGSVFFAARCSAHVDGSRRNDFLAIFKEQVAGGFEVHWTKVWRGETARVRAAVFVCTRCVIFGVGEIYVPIWIVLKNIVPCYGLRSFVDQGLAWFPCWSFSNHAFSAMLRRVIVRRCGLPICLSHHCGRWLWHICPFQAWRCRPPGPRA